MSIYITFYKSILKNPHYIRIILCAMKLADIEAMEDEIFIIIIVEDTRESKREVSPEDFKPRKSDDSSEEKSLCETSECVSNSEMDKIVNAEEWLLTDKQIERMASLYVDLKCPNCRLLQFSTYTELEKHCMKKHSKRPTIILCCNFKIKDVQTLKSHILFRHILQLDDTVNITTVPSQLSEATFKHFNRSIWSATSTSELALQEDKKVIRDSERDGIIQRHSCTLCSKTYSNRKTLYHHCRIHHGQMSDDLLKIKPKKPMEERIKYKEKVIERKKEEKSIEDCLILEDYLPGGYDYKILECDNLEKGFNCKIVFNIDTVEASNKFFEEYKSKNNLRYRLEQTNTRGRILLEKRYCCHRKSQKNCPSKKNTNCPARLGMAIRKGPSENELLCYVTIIENHNHETSNATDLRTLKPSLEIAEKFKAMFECGLSPSQAVLRQKEDLLLLYGEKADDVLANRRICPDMGWAFKYYYKMFGRKYRKKVNKKEAENNL